jgi:cell wall assembly regulator SMI1
MVHVVSETNWLAMLDADRRGLGLRSPASAAVMSEVEDRLGRSFPADLASLLRIANGFDDLSGEWQCATFRLDRLAS